jgi:hypothetical protein
MLFIISNPNAYFVKLDIPNGVSNRCAAIWQIERLISFSTAKNPAISILKRACHRNSLFY